ncbi:MAG: hypothetical protein Q4C10_04100 [Clostridia bacterium]|nr:hypothetical protein [Clostridia bacterium]
MNGRRSVAQYRAMDLFMFALIMAVFETIVVTAARRWFPSEPWAVSVVPAVTAIVLMRWGPWAAIHAGLGGAVFCFMSRASGAQYIIYIIGNLVALGALAIRKQWTPEGIRESTAKSLAFALAVTLLMQLGRAVLAVLMGNPIAAALGFFTTDVVTLLFTLVLIWIARRLDGIFEDQKHYLLRVHEQEKEERGGF